MMKMKSLLIGITITSVFVCSSAFASPAQDLFEQAAKYLTEEYYGFAGGNVAVLVQRYRDELQRACALAGNGCSFDIAREVIQHMLNDLNDPHTYLIPAEKKASAQNPVEDASTPRIGAAAVPVEGSNDLVVTDVRPDGAAGEAGLMRGDRIVAFNGNGLPSGKNENLKAYFQIIRKGAPFTANIIRDGIKPLEINLKPRIANSPWLPFVRKMPQLPSEVVVIRVTDYETGGQVGSRVHSLVNRAQDNGAKAIIIDERDNPGGALTECTTASGAFLESVAVTLSTRREKITYGFKDGASYGATGTQRYTFYKVPKVAAWTGKVVVLVNSDSASCAEEFAENLQLQKRATIIGEPTFGILNTGLFTLGLMDGSGLSVTSVRVYDQNNNLFPERVTPDIAIKDDLDELAKSGRDVMLEKALEVLGYIK